MMAPGFVATYARGVEWAAKGEVSLPAQIDLNPKNKDAVRVLLVAGGHDHETSLYGAFEKMRDIRVNVDPHPNAFRNDLREDLRRDRALRQHPGGATARAAQAEPADFVESGKGVVVLHHAIVDFGGWEWWWKEVVGGRYVLKAEPGYEASKYLHDVELVVTPEVRAPDHQGPGADADLR